MTTPGAMATAAPTSDDPALSPDHSLAALVRPWFHARAHQPCLSCDDVTRTWGEFGARSARVGQGLVAAGVRRGSRVSFLDQNGPEYFELLVGAMMAGGVVASVNWRLAPREMAQVLNLSGASFLLVGASFLDALDTFRDQVPTLAKVVVLGAVADERLREGDERYEDWLARHAAVDPQVPVAPTDTALMMYTSGTTGLPKGVMFSNAGFARTLEMADVSRVDAEATVLVAMPVFHSLGTSFGVLTLGSGGHIVVAREAKPDLLFDLLDRWAISVTNLVPAVLKAMVEAPDAVRRDLPALERVLYAGSPISPELLRRCLDTFGCGMVQLYGLTETQSATALPPEAHLDEDRPWLLESAGRPVAGSRVRVVGPDGRELPEGEVGEVELWAGTAMTGYWNDPDATAATIRPDGFVRTGDAGYVRDGYLFLRDRIKDMVVTGGENVYPVEVENVLLEHPGIVDAAVIGVPSERWGEAVTGIVVRAPGFEELSAGDVVAFCRERLAAYKCPKQVEFLDQLPRNPSGKILKRVLREPYWQRSERRIG
ncbi:long-chain-fatty-acid--CoA ligase [Nocardioides sp. LHD-245]|uniref:long-chain-fatty-acid--CoA ligase n=1 Tax=Nocardioides sp. LHD-245 TaxID=3051387 RepID=UPI0027DF25A2|nr:long-chain-fatty-acid--CoA ligase [Nocardioides sp. LHD-245]